LHEKTREKDPTYEGDSVDAMMQKYIFEPCKMTSAVLDSENTTRTIEWRSVKSGFNIIRDPSKAGAGFTQAERQDDDIKAASDAKMPWFEAGGVVASIEDLAKFFDGLCTGKILKPETFQEMTKELDGEGEAKEYRCGIRVKEQDGNVIYSHGGLSAGTQLEAGYETSEGAYGFVMTYVSDIESIESEMNLTKAFKQAGIADHAEISEQDQQTLKAIAKESWLQKDAKDISEGLQGVEISSVEEASSKSSAPTTTEVLDTGQSKDR
jgi:hypothetical protein